MFLGQDANYDLQGYHLANGQALLRGTFWRDLVPADLQSYFNPLLDAVYAGLATGPLLYRPRVLAAVMGLPFGALLWLAWRFADRLYPCRPLVAAVAAALGCSAAGVASQVGTTFNEVQASVAMMAGLILLFGPGARRVAVAGLLFGAASGLKLTAATFAPAVCLTAACLAPDVRRAVQSAVVCAGGWVAGFLITDGWWAALLLVRFGSPTFPLFNGLFRSAWYPPADFVDRRFLPDGLLAGLFRPFLTVWGAGTSSGEVPMRDYRSAVVLGLALCLGATAAARWRLPSRDACAVSTFLAAGSVCWVFSSGIGRYAVILEVVGGCSLPLLLRELLPEGWSQTGLAASLMVVVPTTSYGDWGRVAYGARSVFADRGAIEADTLIVVTPRSPLSWMLALLPRRPGVSVAGMGFATADARGYRLRDEIARRVAEQRGPIRVLTDGDPLAPAYELGEIGLDARMDECRAMVGTFLRPSVHPMLCSAHLATERRLASPFWRVAAGRYRTLAHPLDPGWTVFGEAYLQAAGEAAAGTHIVDWMDLLWAGVGHRLVAVPSQLDPATLYVIGASEAQRPLPQVDPEADGFGTVDGVAVIAPGWKRCLPCVGVASPVPIRVEPDLVAPPLDRPLRASGSELAGMLGHGWSSPEAEGIWTDGPVASLQFERPAPGPLRLAVVGVGLASRAGGTQDITVVIDGDPSTVWHAGDLQEGRFTVRVPAGSDPVRIRFRIGQPTRPVDRGMGADDRELGLLVRQLQITSD